MARLNQQQLVDISRREVKWYAGVSVDSTAYFFADDSNHVYAVNVINNEVGKNHSMIMMQVRIVDEFVVVDEDKVWDKQLWKALEGAGIPREQIVLAYLGETTPSLTQA